MPGAILLVWLAFVGVHGFRPGSAMRPEDEKKVITKPAESVLQEARNDTVAQGTDAQHRHDVHAAGKHALHVPLETHARFANGPSLAQLEFHSVTQTSEATDTVIHEKEMDDKDIGFTSPTREQRASVVSEAQAGALTEQQHLTDLETSTADQDSVGTDDFSNRTNATETGSACFEDDGNSQKFQLGSMLQQIMQQVNKRTAGTDWHSYIMYSFVALIVSWAVLMCVCTRFSHTTPYCVTTTRSSDNQAPAGWTRSMGRTFRPPNATAEAT